MSPPLIGVIGGMGPYAGLDLVRKLFDETRAEKDQDHLPVALLSYPHRIADRSAFLLGATPTNPAEAIAAVAGHLDDLGATVAGMPCNTAHAPPIFDAVRRRLQGEERRIRLLHLVEETVRGIHEVAPDARRIGVLATLATHRLSLYPETIAAASYDAVVPDDALAEEVHEAIYAPEWGIKANALPVSDAARRRVLEAVAELQARGADAVILGCTELPLAVPEPVRDGVVLVDPARMLARALIRETYPERLAPLPARA